MNICTVSSPAGLELFRHLPYSLYRDSPTWVPPLLEKDGQVVGGIAAFVDALVNEY